MDEVIDAIFAEFGIQSAAVSEETLLEHFRVLGMPECNVVTFPSLLRDASPDVTIMLCLGDAEHYISRCGDHYHVMVVTDSLDVEL